MYHCLYKKQKIYSHCLTLLTIISIIFYLNQAEVEKLREDGKKEHQNEKHEMFYFEIQLCFLVFG